MTTALEQAFPAGDVDNATQRAKLAEQGIIVVDDLDAVTAEDFSIQPWAGICSLADGSLFMYDATDTTSVHDGMTVIVVSGRRYILRTEQTFEGSVASLGDTAPPGSPSLGDAYIIGAAPSGDWASYGKYIAKWTARGWVYRAPAQGMVFWVVDEQTFYHYASDDTWTQGLPVGGIPDGSLSPIKFANPLAVMPVEDERNAPPASVPGAGTAYIVGSSPSGAFTGYAGHVARSNGTGYDFIAPFEGALVHNRDADALYSYRSGAWGLSVTPSAAQNFWRSSASGVDLGGVSATPETVDTISGVQGTSGNIWEVVVYLLEAAISFGGISFEIEFGVYIDNPSTPDAVIVAVNEEVTGTADLGAPFTMFIEVPDSASHDISIKARRTDGAVLDANPVNVSWLIKEWKPTA